MKKEDNIQQELNHLAPVLATAPKTSLYTVHPAYFATLALEVLKKIKRDNQDTYQFTKVMPFSVPSDYFSKLPEDILSQIRKANNSKNEVEAELETIAPFLNQVKKKTPYTAPTGYFDQLNEEFYKPEPPTARVVNMSWIRRSGKYVAAAIVTAITAISALLLIEGKQTGNNTIVTAQIELQSLSEQEIADFLGTAAAVEAGNSVIFSEVQDKQIKQSLSKVSEKEIQEFLQEEYGEMEGI